MNKMNWTESPMHEYGSITTSHKYRKHSSVMVKVPDSLSSDLGLILGEVCNFFVNYTLLDSSN